MVTPILYIQQAVADYYEITRADIIGPSRRRVFARPRQLAMWLARTHTDKSLPEIGDAFSGRDHTTIMHGVEATKERLDVEMLHDAGHIMLDAAKLWRKAQKDLKARQEAQAEQDFNHTQQFTPTV